MLRSGCKVRSSAPCSSEWGNGGCGSSASLLAMPQRRSNPEDRTMKHMLSGTAIAVALVIAAPVWGQTSGTRMAPSSGAPATSAPMGSMSSHMRSHRVRARHHARRHGKARMGSSDEVANQLNAQEAARTGGAPPPAYGRATGPYGQPNQLYGIPGAGQASPSPEYPTRPSAYVPGSNVSQPSPYGQRSPTQGIPGAGQVPQSPDYPSGPGPRYVPGQYQVSPSPNAPAAR
jgi:hypothetical protein